MQLHRDPMGSRAQNPPDSHSKLCSICDNIGQTLDGPRLRPGVGYDQVKTPYKQLSNGAQSITTRGHNGSFGLCLVPPSMTSPGWFSMWQCHRMVYPLVKTRVIYQPLIPQKRPKQENENETLTPDAPKKKNNRYKNK
ncbi:hypothetical protein JTE90_002114 [Oedothorax gibbosus]|uniref:Uncharacterized protein n=1 Tax=Oedothorax gibbosus TaxID=931172 RepID=A0AAV6V6T0_9ARAC|nr:hypothetical protein JTE90_002114 [Oedothorax gibbosus]